jgi:competence protein ComEC
VAALVGLVVVGWPVRQAVRGWPPAGTLVVACDVGQGDAFVVPTGRGAGVLVDAGPDAGAVDRCLDRLGIDALPLVLMSHLDADHAAGLPGALAGRDIGVVATGTLAPTDERVDGFEALVRRSGGEREVLVPGDRRTVGTASIEVLAPAPERATAAAAANDLSLVARITQRGVRTLFTGDLSAMAEARILASGADLGADVLKVPHHGSADADPAFLAASGARVALISVGADNTYGHPTRRLLTWLARGGMRVHRTDREGDLAVVGSGAAWGVAARERDSGGSAAAGHGGVARGGNVSAPRDTMQVCRPTPWNPHPASAWWSARRSCCGRGRSPRSAPPCSPTTRIPRCTNSRPAGWRWASWPTSWRPPCSAATD